VTFATTCMNYMQTQQIVTRLSCDHSLGTIKFWRFPDSLRNLYPWCITHIM